MQPSFMLLAIPFFLIAMGIEWFYSYSKKKEWYRLNDSVNNIIIGLGQQLFSLITKALVFGLFIWIQTNYSIMKIPSTWWSFVLCFLLFDFLFYWAHRFGHEMNLFWGAHSVHHQSEEYNLSVALRQSWFHNMLALVLFLPIPFLGFDPVIFGVAAIVHTLSQFWIHTKAIGKLHPWIEYWINTPSHHRVHHAINPEYIDKNHAGFLMIWDRLFGTFKEEETDTPIYYGITTQLKSWNPAWANVHYYIEMFQKARTMIFKDKLRLVFAKPGWLPEYMGGFQKVQPVDSVTYTKYDTTISTYYKIYALAQFIIMLVLSVMYMANYSNISSFYRITFFVLILLTMLLTGAIFENKHWIIYAEYARLFIVLISLNTFYYFWHIDFLHITIVTSLVCYLLSIAFFTYTYIHTQRKQELAQ